MNAEQPKIYHHHTPRQYLLPWADADERIAWMGYGKVQRSGLTVVGGENKFYKLKDLTVADIDCLKLFIDGLPVEPGRENHKRFLEIYILPTQLKARLDRRVAANGRDTDEAQIAEGRHLLDVAISNLNENYHAAIERTFWPFLERIKIRDLSWYEEPTEAREFFHGLFVQYFRTKAARERACQKENVLFDDMERVWDVLSYILAVEAGRSLFCSRTNFQIIILDNNTAVPFITSDQPIINGLAKGGGWDVPDKMEIYYPLSPKQAMLLLEKSTPTARICQNVSIDDAHRYNMMMLDHSGLRIFSDSEEYLFFLRRCMDARG